MKRIQYFLAAVMLCAALPALASAQAAEKSALVDSANKHLQKGGKPAKSKGVTAQSLEAKSSASTKHSTVAPAITSAGQSVNKSAAPAKSARTANAADTSKSLPAVQRASMKPKTKPPTK